MSGFDKEAERERLREKYDRDQEKRAATQRMSELLLKGATMTNSHCDTCGDPIFRHDGQAFCPTCQAGDDASAGADAEPDAPDPTDAEAAAPDPADAEVGTASTPTRTAEVTDHEAAAADGHATRVTDADDGRRAPSTVDAERSPVRGDDAQAPDAGGSVPSARAADADTDADADPVGTARASLSRTLVRYTRAAEDAEDPRRAAELLSAAREAAETLAALDEVR